MTDRNALFEPASLGAIDLPNRVLMAPLTRNRSHGDGTPKRLAAEYYTQRASGGVLFTEATQISPMGKGYIDTPGIHDAAHVAAWREITDAVHDAGGRIVIQLWHVGRISHSSLLPDGRAPVSSSAVRAEAQTFTASGFEPVSEPEALTEEGITELLAEYRNAAQMAADAGFDGVEIHAANGYLLDQFLQDSVNQRDDKYGGPVENRIRLLAEVIDAVAEVWPVDRIGVRVSPLGQFNDMGDSDPEALFGAVYSLVGDKGLAFLHVVEEFPGADTADQSRELLQRIRQRFDGFYIANGGFDADSGAAAIASGHADAITFGRPFLANPDLPERYRVNAPLNDPDPTTFYGGGVEGYTDYPTLAQTKAAE